MLELRTERLCLREFEDADIPVLHAYNLHPMARRYESGPPVTESQFRQIIHSILADQAETPRQDFYFAIVRDTQVIGSCYLAIRDMTHRRAETGYMLGYPHWGQGYATEAARAAVEFGFEALGLHRIYAEVLSENTASRRVLEKIGMRHEGTLHETDYFNERWWHTCIYAILEHEWHERPRS